MKKLLLWGGIGFAILIVIVVVVSLIGRGNNTRKTQSGTQKIILNFWDPIDDPAVFKDIITAYQEIAPNVKINLIAKPLQDYELESSNAIASDKGPDVWMIPNSSVLRHQDSLAPVPENFFQKNKNDHTTNTQYIKGRYVPIVVKENVNDNKIYGLPLFVDTLALFSNPHLLGARANALQNSDFKFDPTLFNTGPRTWNELVDLVKQYTAKSSGNQIDQSALAMGRSDNVDEANDILAALMLQNGTVMSSPDGLTATFNLPSQKQINQKYFPGTKALDFFTSFSNPNSPNYTWNESMPSSYEAFRDEKVAMIFEYSDILEKLKQENPNLSVRVFPLPQIKGSSQAIDYAKYWTLTVPKNSPNSAAAWNFINYLSTDGLSTYLSTAHQQSPLIPQSVPQTISDRIGEGRPFRFQSQTAASWYRGKDPDKVGTIFTDMVNKVTNQNIPSQTAIDDAARKVSEVFRLREGFNTTPSPTPQKTTQ